MRIKGVSSICEREKIDRLERKHGGNRKVFVEGLAMFCFV